MRRNNRAVIAFDLCVGRGLHYYVTIEAYPRLSDGRLALQFVRDRCAGNVDAFKCIGERLEGPVEQHSDTSLEQLSPQRRRGRSAACAIGSSKATSSLMSARWVTTAELTRHRKSAGARSPYGRWKQSAICLCDHRLVIGSHPLSVK